MSASGKMPQIGVDGLSREDRDRFAIGSHGAVRMPPSVRDLAPREHAGQSGKAGLDTVYHPSAGRPHRLRHIEDTAFVVPIPLAIRP